MRCAVGGPSSIDQLSRLRTGLGGIPGDIHLSQVGVHALRLAALGILMDMALQGLGFPVVLVNGAPVCFDGVDVEAVVCAVRRVVTALA